MMNTLVPVLEDEERKLAKKMTGRQDDTGRPRSLKVQHVIGAQLLGLGLSSLLVSALLPRKELQDHPQCGTIKDGKVRVQLYYCRHPHSHVYVGQATVLLLLLYCIRRSFPSRRRACFFSWVLVRIWENKLERPPNLYQKSI